MGVTHTPGTPEAQRAQRERLQRLGVDPNATNPSKPTARNRPVKAGKPKMLTDSERSAGMDALRSQHVKSLGTLVEPHTLRYTGGSGLRGGMTTNARMELARNTRTIEEYDRRAADIERAHGKAYGSDFAYRNYLRTGAVEHRDLAAGTTPGSYLVPPDLMDDLLFGVQFFSAILPRARLWKSVTPSGKPFGGPALVPMIASDLTQNVGKLGANTLNSNFVPGGATGFQQVSFSNAPLYIAADLARVGYALMQDAQTDIAAMVNELFAQRIGRQLDSDFVATILAGATNVTTTAAPTAISLADLSALFGSLDAAHIGSPNTALVVSTKTRWYLQTQLVDSQGRPLMSETAFTIVNESTSQEGGSVSRAVRVPTLFGVPVVTSPAMSNIAALANTAILANFDNAFVFRFVEASVQRLNEKYGDYAQIGFNGWFRADGVIADQLALAVLKQHS